MSSGEYIEEEDELDKVLKPEVKKPTGKVPALVVKPTGEIEQLVRSFCAAKANVKIATTKLSSVPDHMLREDGVKQISDRFYGVEGEVPTQVKYICDAHLADEVDVEMGRATVVGEVLKPACSLKVGIRKGSFSAFPKRTSVDDAPGAYDLLMDTVGPQWMKENTLMKRSIAVNMNLVPKDKLKQTTAGLSQLVSDLDLPAGVISQVKTYNAKSTFWDAIRMLPIDQHDKVCEIIDVPTEVRV